MTPSKKDTIVIRPMYFKSGAGIVYRQHGLEEDYKYLVYISPEPNEKCNDIDEVANFLADYIKTFPYSFMSGKDFTYVSLDKTKIICGAFDKNLRDCVVNLVKNHRKLKNYSSIVVILKTK